MNLSEIDAKIQEAVDEARSRIEDTQTLYREAATILFFRFNVTPTANKLYQYVRKGSMSAPAEALRKFWEELRDKSRVRIECPDLPQELRDLSGELIGRLWAGAQEQAQQNYEVLRQESDVLVSAAQTKQAEAEQALLAAQDLIQKLEQDNKGLNWKVSDLDKQLAGEKFRGNALQLQVGELSSRLADADIRIATAQRDFKDSLDTQTHAHQEALQELNGQLDGLRRQLIAKDGEHKEESALLRAELEKAQQEVAYLRGVVATNARVAAAVTASKKIRGARKVR